MSTTFTFTCEKWTDPEPPLTYEFSYGDEQNQTIFAYRISPSGVNVRVTNWLIAGDENNNYIRTVQFTIKDSLGSVATQYIDVKVGFNGPYVKRMIFVCGKYCAHFYCQTFNL